MGLEQERRRVALLHEYDLLDTPPTAELEAVTRVAAAIAGVPAATLNLLDDFQQYQLTAVGHLPRTCGRDESMCAVHLDRGEFVHLRDAREEPRYRDNPWVTGELGRIVFYASAPLISPGGLVMGTLCVTDGVPRQLTADQIDRLQDLAGIVVAFFERRRHARLSGRLAETIQAREEWTRAVLDNIDQAVIAIAPDGRVTLFNRAARETHRPDTDLAAPPEGSASRYRLYEPDGLTPVPDGEVPLVAVTRTGEPVSGKEMVIREPGREPRRVLANAAPLRAGDGAVNGAVVALHDVTAEHTRRRIIQEAHERLAAANAELRRSNTDLSHFAAAVGHDLVAPLAAVGGYLELLADLDDADLTGADPDGADLNDADLNDADPGGADMNDADPGGAEPGAIEPGATRRERVRGWTGAASQAVARMRDMIDALLAGARAGGTPVRQDTPAAGATAAVTLPRGSSGRGNGQVGGPPADGS